MFENQQKDVEVLMKSDVEFRSLYQRHKELDGKVRDAELGVLPMDDTTLHNMKKEKLQEYIFNIEKINEIIQNK